jgi:putative radical SAM enzyme (TIGR03279 family)
MTETRHAGPHKPAPGGGVLQRVQTGSLAHRAGLRPGDRVLSIDGHELRDAIDYRFYAAEASIRLSAMRNGSRLTFAINKHPDEELGLHFEDALFDGLRTCNNRCFFCFLRGLPKGLRSSLYVKDDDYRLSFLHGSFITLTNLGEEDWRRIGEQRLSPLYVSVHATEPRLRRYLLGNPSAPNVMPQLRRLKEMGIAVHTQVVLCPGVNDGPHLARTVQDLAGLYPAVRSIAVVPAGASKYAKDRIARAGHGQEMQACSPEGARSLLRQAAPWQREFRRRWGVSLVYLADEYYLAAGAALPSAARYDGYPQFENGVGMARSLIEGWRRARQRAGEGVRPRSGLRRVTLVCGTLIEPLLPRLTLELEELTGLRLEVIALENRFFGRRVNVSGLLVAEDVVEDLRGRSLGDLVVLPRHALDHAGERFLDDGTPGEVQATLGVPIAFARTVEEVLGLVASEEKTEAGTL